MTVTQAIETYLRQHPFIEEALTDGIINYAGLARYIREEIARLADQPVKDGAIIMALRRLSPSYYYQVRTGIKNFLTRLDNFIVRSDINDYTFKNSSSLLLNQRQIFEKVAQDPEIFYSFSHGIYESTIIASQDLHSIIAESLQAETRLSLRSNLAAITTLLPKDNTEISGIYYFIFKQLAWQNINVVEVVSTTNEFTIVVAESDVNRSFRLLRELKKLSSSPRMG